MLELCWRVVGRGSKDNRTSLLEGILEGFGLAGVATERVSSATETDNDLLAFNEGLSCRVFVGCPEDPESDGSGETFGESVIEEDNAFRF